MMSTRINSRAVFFYGVAFPPLNLLILIGGVIRYCFGFVWLTLPGKGRTKAGRVILLNSNIGLIQLCLIVFYCVTLDAWGVLVYDLDYILNLLYGVYHNAAL